MWRMRMVPLASVLPGCFRELARHPANQMAKAGREVDVPQRRLPAPRELLPDAEHAVQGDPPVRQSTLPQVPGVEGVQELVDQRLTVEPPAQCAWIAHHQFPVIDEGGQVV